MKQIKKATEQDRKKVEELRISEFSRSTEFTLLKPEKLLWSKTDDESIVLLVLDENMTALSTMRGITVNERTEAEKILKCTVPASTDFPAIIFTSAATLKPFRRRGFNQLLRLYFIQYALKNSIKTLLSPVYKNAPRIEFMKKLNYIFITPEKNWQKKLNPKSERQLGILVCEHFEHAINIIKQNNSFLIKEYPWHGQDI
ncbi:hypothetical protein MTBBW1_280007 [Desulfamplus magnetovallimortis]|uniref:N-acetyltransferase domain-containing protein n=1 Tax=Desulfamplus magnetovallimortis TaxID=1246637 RepID=A0A1W1HF86_9BACT|nr:hypothetical protein [Desulfamplus magnetovallimortis]SLM31171.1 hypothetical protein MTBBW1_280007 [Desulfamplus magnetovallimortis]